MSSAVMAATWPAAGNDPTNSRYQAGEATINASTVGSLHLLWSLSTDGDVTANPALDDAYLYFPDSAGFLYKVNRQTGALVWKNPVASYTGITGDYARATPAIVGNTLIIGNQSGKLDGQSARPAHVFAVDKNTGNLLWNAQVDSTQLSIVTQSAVVANGTAFVGIASHEELAAGSVSPWPWQFRGSVVALDVLSGAIKWRSYTVPQGYYGGAIWGSTGAVDVAHNTVYMASGNNYAVPQSVLDCLNGGGSPASCISPDDHFDSILALDMTTGAIKWSARGLPFDVWNLGCGLDVPGFSIPPNDNCPNPKGPDWDFAQGPMLFGGTGNTGRIVGVGQKSGVFWAFDAVTGALRWSTQVAPGGRNGGLQWGSANDGTRIYVAVSNSAPTGGATPNVWQLTNGRGTTTSGGWAALNVNSGQVLWTTPDPLGSRAEAAVSAANDVVFGCNVDPVNGTMYALDAKSGDVLWSFNSGGACTAGPSVADGVVFWGTGNFRGSGPHKVFAFGL
jgi:polyvinyl alcohol dehydrogenase (cytochrome)